MNLLQTWLIVGVPGLIVVAGLFVGRSQWRSLTAYGVLAAVVLTFLLVPGDVISAAAVGLIGFFFVATGRGTAADDVPEHHKTRAKYTHADRG
jgi:hypothetical protein